MYSCFHSVGLHNLSLLEMVERVSKAGYSAVELNAETLPFAKPHITPLTDQKGRRVLINTCKQLDLKIQTIGAKICMIDEDLNARIHSQNFVKGCIDLAEDLNVEFVHILSGECPSSVNRKEAWGWFADAVEILTEYGKSKKINLGLEIIAGHLFCAVNDYHQLYSDLSGIPFKVMFDPSHIIVQGEDPRWVPDKLGDKICHVHLKDGSGRYPNFSFPPLGEGEIDFVDLVKRLRNIGYNHALSVEYEAQVYGFKRTEDYIVDGQKKFVDELILS